MSLHSQCWLQWTRSSSPIDPPSQHLFPYHQFPHFLFFFFSHFLRNQTENKQGLLLNLPVSTTNHNSKVRAELGESSGSGPTDPTRSTQYKNAWVASLLRKLNNVAVRIIMFTLFNASLYTRAALQLKQSLSGYHYKCHYIWCSALS